MFHLKGDHITGWEVRAGDIETPIGKVERNLVGEFVFRVEGHWLFGADALKELSMKLQYVNGRWPQQTWIPEDDDLPF